MPRLQRRICRMQYGCRNRLYKLQINKLHFILKTVIFIFVQIFGDKLKEIFIIFK